MTYIYAYSNHKYGFSRLRRMAGHYKTLQEQGVEVEMLTNDFRAAAVIREYGVFACTTIEPVWDIDFVAERGDHLIMDTPEDDQGKLEQYVEMFAEVQRVAISCEDTSRYGEEVLYPDPMTDPWYASYKEKPKVESTLFFYGDSDPEKWLEKQVDFFTGLEMDLLLGEYFYQGYEETLMPLFSSLHEAEAYREKVAQSQRVVTCVAQTAYEANSAGAEVIYLGTVDTCQRQIMEALAIKIVPKTDKELLQKLCA
jgi:hypothetical protein